MRLTALLLVTGCLSVAAAGHTQGISLSVKNQPLQKVFAELKKQTGYSFIWDEADIKKTNKITIDVKNATLPTVLDEIFKEQPLSYKIIGNLVVIKPKTETPNADGGSEQLPPPIDISGRVTDADGNPLSGATVKVKGTSKGTTTNNDGVFVLKAVDENATLEISFVGYETYTVAVANKTSIVASLKVNVQDLKGIVINKGYYKTNKITEVGNVSTVKSKEIEKQPVNNVLLALQGRVPGMVITQVNGLPGSGVQVQIRGQRSIANGNLPLYIIDGVPYQQENLPNLGAGILGSSSGAGDRGGNPLIYINPLDIESVDVLKDADATAIYGSRGANGVILITTKKGKPGKLKVDVNMQTGWGKVNSKMDLLNTQQYLAMRHEAKLNDNLAVRASDYDINGTWDTTRYTDWQKELIGGTAKYNDVQASISGGSNNTSYLVSGNYHKESTVFPGDFNNKRGSLHFDLNSSSSNQRLHFLLSSIYATIDNHLPNADLTESALTLAPDAPALYNSDGTLNWANSTWSNPIANYLGRNYKNQTNNLISNSVISYEVIKGLEVKSSFGYTNTQTNEVTTYPAAAKNPAFWLSSGIDLRSSEFYNTTNSSWIIEPQASYSTNLSKGKLSALVGTTIQQNKNNGLRVAAKGFNSDQLIENPLAATATSIGNYFNSVYKYNALFARINYNWEDKYLINLTGRRDGSSRFGPANRFHNFSAAGIGWVFSRESLIENKLKFLSFGKIRASYGTTGSDQIGDYTYLDLYNPTNAEVAYQGSTGLSLTRHFTPDLQWEQTNQFEAAIELGLLKDRIMLQGSYYFNSSSNQLVNFALSNVTGFTSISKNLNATVQNKGWEFSLNTVNLNSKNVRWNTSFVIFWNKNKLSSIDSGMTNSNYKELLGHPLSSMFVYKYAGVNPTTGLYQFIDSHGSTIASPDYLADRTVLIDKAPKFTAGLQNTIQFKNFQVDFFFQMVKQTGQNQLFFLVPGYWTSSGGNQPTTVLANHWQKPGDVAAIQKFNSNGRVITPYRNVIISDMLYDDLYFVKLKNVSVSWNLPGVSKKSTPFQYLKVFINGQNLVTFTNYKGMDPESMSVTSLPPLRVITTGIQIGL